MTDNMSCSDAIQKGRERMKQKMSILVVFIAIMLLLTACGAGDTSERPAGSSPDVEAGDTVERFAEASSGSGESIDIPGYESLTLQAGSKSQSVYLQNPEKNAAYFVMTLTLENGETLWKGKELYPGEAFTDIKLNKPLKAGSYAAILHYDCFSVSDNEPLNGAEVQLTLTVHEKN